MSNGALVTAAKDKVCQGCGGKGAGNHTDLRCPFLAAEAGRTIPKDKNKRQRGRRGNPNHPVPDVDRRSRRKEKRS